MEIRKITLEEYSLAHDLFILFQVDDGIEKPDIPSDAYMKEILRKNGFHVIIALDNETIAGGLTAFELPMYKKPIMEMFLFEIGVMKKYRRQGIGKRLIEYLVAL